jgi:hypothetical protein
VRTCAASCCCLLHHTAPLPPALRFPGMPGWKDPSDPSTHDMQLWRLLTNYFFLGKFSIFFVVQILWM